MAVVGLPLWLRWLPLVVVVVSWFDWAPHGLAMFGRAGLYWGSTVTLAGIGAAVWSGTFRSLRSSAADRELRRFAAVGAALIGAWILAAVGAIDRVGAFLGAGRVLVILLFLVASWAVTAADDCLRERLAWAAFAFVGFQFAVLVLGWTSDRVAAVVFERLPRHIHAGLLPRFRGLASQPMACGSATLLVAGLLAGLSRRPLRLAGIVAALTVVLATFSFATLVLPIAIVVTLPVRRAVRAAASVCIGAVALTALWVNPLRVEILGRTLLDRAPVPNYFRDGLGPRYAPIRALVVPGFQFQFHPTGYALLAGRAVSCLWEHPLGVGAANFVRACPVMAMNTAGGWGDRRSAHNAYGALLAEGGILGTGCTVVFVLMLVRKFRFRSGRRLEAGVLGAYLVAGFAGATPYQFPFAILLALATERRAREGVVLNQRSAPGPRGPKDPAASGVGQDS